MLISVLAVLCILLMSVAMLLHLFGLPANWVALVCAILWFFLVPGNGLTWGVVGLLITLAVSGEILEMLLGLFWGRKYGASGKAGLAGMIGAFAGAIAGASFLFGIGAFPGAMAGAFAASLLAELVGGAPVRHAVVAAWGTMLGRFGGTVMKAAIGCAMIAIAAPRILPG